MKNTIPELDAYIANAAEFARPILEKIRKAAHLACPDIEEAMKWSSPTFLCEGIVAGMSAHKQHVRFGFWKGALMKELAGLEPIGNTCMRGLRVETASDLPNQKKLVAAFREAVRLNRDGVKVATPKQKAKRPAPKTPADLLAALKKNERALATYEGFSPSNKREYVQWITEAKRDATRAKRLAQAIEWMAAGKPRNWRYMNC